MTRGQGSPEKGDDRPVVDGHISVMSYGIPPPPPPTPLAAPTKIKTTKDERSSLCWQAYHWQWWRRPHRRQEEQSSIARAETPSTPSCSDWEWNLDSLGWTYLLFDFNTKRYSKLETGERRGTFHESEWILSYRQLSLLKTEARAGDPRKLSYTIVIDPRTNSATFHVGPTTSTEYARCKENLS